MSDERERHCTRAVGECSSLCCCGLHYGVPSASLRMITASSIRLQTAIRDRCGRRQTCESTVHQDPCMTGIVAKVSGNVQVFNKLCRCGCASWSSLSLSPHDYSQQYVTDGNAGRHANKQCILTQASLCQGNRCGGTLMSAAP